MLKPYHGLIKIINNIITIYRVSFKKKLKHYQQIIYGRNTIQWLPSFTLWISTWYSGLIGATLNDKPSNKFINFKIMLYSFTKEGILKSMNLSNVFMAIRPLRDDPIKINQRVYKHKLQAKTHNIYHTDPRASLFLN